MSKTTQQNAAQSGADLNAEQGTQEQSTPSTQTQGAQTSQNTEQGGIIGKISPLPTPPSSNDSGSFVERADKFFMALPKFAEELNAFGSKVDTSINEKIQSTAKLTKDELFKHSEQAINSKMQNIKDELVLQVAQETNELVRKSYRLLELNTITNKDSLPFQLVWRANDGDKTKIVRYGDVFVPQIHYETTKGFFRLSLPYTLGQVKEYENDLRYKAAQPSATNAEKITVKQGCRYTKTVTGHKVKSITTSALCGFTSYELSEDKLEAKIHYDAPVGAELDDEISININGAINKITVRVEANEIEGEENEVLSWQHIEGHTYHIMAAPEPLSNFVFFFGVTHLNNPSLATSYNGEAQTPIKFVFPAKIKQIFCGGKHAPKTSLSKIYSYGNFVLLENGDVFVMGYNSVGNLGFGNKVVSVYFVKNPYLKNIKELFIGSYEYSNFALDNEGKLFAWGANSYGQLGLKKTSEVLKPELVEFDFKSKVVSVETSLYKNFVLCEDGSVFVAGYQAHYNQKTNNNYVFDSIKDERGEPLKSVKSIYALDTYHLAFFVLKDKSLAVLDYEAFSGDKQYVVNYSSHQNIQCFKSSLSLRAFLNDKNELFVTKNEFAMAYNYVFKSGEALSKSEFVPFYNGKKIIDFVVKSNDRGKGTLSLVLFDEKGDLLLHSTDYILELMNK